MEAEPALSWSALEACELQSGRFPGSRVKMQSGLTNPLEVEPDHCTCRVGSCEAFAYLNSTELPRLSSTLHSDHVMMPQQGAWGEIPPEGASPPCPLFAPCM